MSVLASLITNLVGKIYSKEGRKPKQYTPQDFMPEWDRAKEEESKEQSVDEMKQILYSIAGKDTKKNG